MLSLDPYPIEKSQQVLTCSRRRQYINIFGREYECRAWKGRELTNDALPR